MTDFTSARDEALAAELARLEAEFQLTWAWARSFGTPPDQNQPPTALAAQALAAAEGAADATRLLEALAEADAPTNALLNTFQSVRATHSEPRLAAFARTLQKALEVRR